ncbi:hypothetical protein [Streptomyces sp. YU58]|uniref:hypothetical protein n=1 Tax=Streptomyces sp. SX92 TaxID=3158972 RepID=UPI0027BB0120|nr:hypothetical protein [Streptomyces coralus]WLW50428.1 hypothetical protein QU709_03255 [Streptomyces coralus]
MITAWSLPRIVRTRVSAGPLLRVVGLAVLLFGVVFTHAVNVESAKGHMVTSAAAPASALPDEARDATDTQAMPRLVAAGGGHDHHGSSHPGEQCLSAPPHPGPVLTPPCFAASFSESAASGRVAVQRGLSDSAVANSPSAAVRSSVVQQV